MSRRSVVLRALTALAPAAALLTMGLPADAAPTITGMPAAGSMAAAAAKRVDSNVVDTTSRSAVRTAYLNRWLPAKLTMMTPGDGSTGSCKTSTTSAARQQATAEAVNFARGLVGESAVHFTTKYNDAAAKAALIMAANKQLSHDPPKSWKCWTQAGHDAAGKSNIELTSQVPSAASLTQLYLDDPGADNGAAGHRRWLLRPEATTMGSGNAQGSWFANALYVFTFADDNAAAPAEKFYSWPNAGWSPDPLEPAGRWSLSSSTGASFANATVTMTGPTGAAVPVTRKAIANGYGDNTLVWDLKTPPAAVTGTGTSTYNVKVSGIKGGSSSTYSYQVKLFDPTLDAPAAKPPTTIAASPVATSSGIRLSSSTAKRRSTRVTVTITTTASDTSRPAGTLALWVAGRHYGDYSITKADNGTRKVRLKAFTTSGAKKVYVAFKANTSYRRSVSKTVKITVR